MFDYEPVLPALRRLMLDELEVDASAKNVYLNPLLKPGSPAQYLQLLLATLEAGTPESFAAALAETGLFQAEHTYIRQGRSVTAKLPANYASTLAAGEFNRYYMRAVCRHAAQEGLLEVEIYRAKPVQNPRQTADERIGRRIEPQTLLEDLRRSNFESPSEYGLGAPNSGLSVRIPN